MNSLQVSHIERQNWKQLASVQAGGSICLPLLLVGYELAKQGNPATIFFSILWGNILLFGLALIAGWMSAKRELTTVEQAAIYFGPVGRIFFAFTLGCSMLCWFAIQSQFMGSDIIYFVQHSFLMDVNDNLHQIFSLFLALLMIMGAFWGIKFFTWMSNLCIPILVGTIGFAIYRIYHLPWEAVSFSYEVWSGKAISMVLASSIAATVDLPTFYRHADSLKSTVKASAINYLFAIPLIQLSGMWLYQGTSAPSIQTALSANASMPWEIWVLTFMLLAGWTTNNMNLYSGALCIKSFAKNISFSTAMGLAGLVGALLVLAPVLEKFSLVLDLMGIFVAAMGGSMFMAYLIECVNFKIKPIFVWSAWSLGIVAGFVHFLWPGFGSGAPVLDAGIVSMVGLLLFKIVQCMITEFPAIVYNLKETEQKKYELKEDAL